MRSIWMQVSSLFENAQHHRALRMYFTDDQAPLQHLLLPVRLDYEEHLSAPYTAALTCLSLDSSLKLTALLGQPVHVQIDHAGGTRTFAGHVDRATQLGSDGGVGSYRLDIRPGLSLLSRRRTSRIFQDLSVPDIVAQVLHEHTQRNSALASMLQLEQQLGRPPAPRSYCTQFNETDLDFIQRLLAEEGINYRVVCKHQDGPPAQTILLFDDAAALEPASPGLLQFRSEGNPPSAACLLSWQPHHQVVSTASSVASHDYKPGQTHQGSDASVLVTGNAATALGTTLEDYGALPPYAAHGPAGLQRRAELQQMREDLRGDHGYGTTRCLGPLPGQWVQIEGHPALHAATAEQRQFVVTGQHLAVCNNLPRDVTAQLASGPLALAGGRHAPTGQLAALPEDTGPDTTLVRFAAVRRALPLVPTPPALLHRPTAPGPQTATVVGRAGEVVDTDAMGRVRIQMHWVREEEHANGGAAFDQRASTWMRCVQPSAGDQQGHQFIPRIGDEVLVAFLQGDIDRPVVVGAVRSGRQAPPDFSSSGTLPGNRTLSGIHTREHHGTHASELLFDDTPGQPRARLATSYDASALNLGFLTTPRRNGEATPRGEGAELRTDGAAALRGARGLLLSTEAQPAANGTHLQRDDLLRGLGMAHDLVNALSEAAEAQALEPADAAALQGLLQALRQWEEGSNVQPDGSNGGTPLAALHADAGLVIHTAGATTVASGTTLDLAADQVQHSARRHWRAHAGEALTLFAQGTRRAVAALRMIAARGDVHLAAHDGDLQASATGDVHLQAGTATVISVANGPVRILGGGGCLLQMEGGNVDLHCPGAFTVKASVVDMDGGAHASVAQNQWPQTDYNERFQARFDTGEPARHCRYELIRADGARLQGTADAEGMIELQQGVTLEEVTVRLLPAAQEPLA